METAKGSWDSAYRGVPVLVLGGSGFIGAWTVRALLARGAAVTIGARDEGRVARVLGPAAADVRTKVVDLAMPAAVRQLVETAAPAVVFNLAGYGVDRSERDLALMAALNAGLVGELCHALASSPVPDWPTQRLVHAGSGAEYGPLEGTLGETRAGTPATDYGRTKLDGTRLVGELCSATGLRAVVARLFTVYGPGEHSDKLLSALRRTAKTGVRLGLTRGLQRRDFTYVEDVAEGLLRLGVSAGVPGEVVNLATGCSPSVRAFAETAASVLGFDASLLDFGALPDRDDEMWQGEVDVTRLGRLTSWVPPTSIADGIRRSWESDDVS